MLTILKYGGIGSGGLNFDAKVRRESIAPEDLFHAHIGSMDAFAKGLKIAAAIRNDGGLSEIVSKRYRSWDQGIGAEIEADKHTLESLESFMLQKGDADANVSGRQEMIENYINRFVSTG